ncbi:MAG TPA: hypothetical protein VD902_17035 [Symbiobacteriaceae bacterium]|nr:hypothetical protein [Symbiobacteriaceae bacterium]
MANPLRHVTALAEDTGPRGACSAGEARAAGYIAEAARQYTHQVWLEPFRSFTSPSFPWLFIVSLLLVSGLVVWISPRLAAALAAVGAVCFVGQTLGWTEAGWLFPRRQSRNVVAVVPAGESIRRRVVILAHYDSPRAALPMIGSGPGQLVLSAAALALPVLTYLSAYAPHLACLVTVPTAVMAVTLVRLVRHEVSAPFVSGEAGGAAAVLTAGAQLARAPLQYTEVWTVFTGCREPGMVGLHALLGRHGHVLRDADFVVLDQVGPGALAYTIAEGTIPFRTTTPELQALLKEAGVQGKCLRRRVTQAGLALDQGYRAIAMLTPEPGPVDRTGIERAAGVVRTLAEALDRKACAEVEQGEA